MVARWRPVHLGHAAVLRALCARADDVVIGIGSSNRLDARNPFTVEETLDMIRLVLPRQHEVDLVPVPDLGDGPRWGRMVADLLGDLGLFVTANPWVASLMDRYYRLAHPIDLIPEEERVPVDGTMVRREMARGEGWRELVPEAVVAYIVDNRLDQRFRREYGLEILAQDAP